MERKIFLGIFLCMEAVLLFLIYRTQSALLGTLFFAVLVVAAGFYLLQFGTLSSFTVEALTAKASFIKEKVEQAQEDSEAIRRLRGQTEKMADDISTILDDLRRTEREIETSKGHLRKLMHDLAIVKVRFVEIAYLQYAGRNIFPNPYHERIMAGINNLLAIAVPDPSQRVQFIQELEQYTQEARSRQEESGDNG